VICQLTFTFGLSVLMTKLLFETPDAPCNSFRQKHQAVPVLDATGNGLHLQCN
jgi:hypothetical protein